MACQAALPSANAQPLQSLLILQLAAQASAAHLAAVQAAANAAVAKSQAAGAAAASNIAQNAAVSMNAVAAAAELQVLVTATAAAAANEVLRRAIKHHPKKVARARAKADIAAAAKVSAARLAVTTLAVANTAKETALSAAKVSSYQFMLASNAVVLASIRDRDDRAASIRYAQAVGAATTSKLSDAATLEIAAVRRINVAGTATKSAKKMAQASVTPTAAHNRITKNRADKAAAAAKALAKKKKKQHKQRWKRYLLAYRLQFLTKIVSQF